MIFNNLKYAFRHMARYRLFSLINIAGLSIGIAICFTLFLWVHDEMSYDRFHENSDRIYRSLWEARFGDNSWKIPQVPVPLAGTMESEFPEVEVATQAYEGRFTVKKGEEYVREPHVLFVDEKFFNVFTLNTLAGSTGEALNNPDAVLITNETAARYFGSQLGYDEIIGRTIQRNDDKLMIISGIVESFPPQSHLKFDFLASLKNLEHIEHRKTHWGSASVLTYFLLAEEGDPKELHNKVQNYVDQNLIDESFRQSGNFTSFPFEPIADIHLKPNLSYIWIFGTIGAFILILACINFINLTTAQVIRRSREVGIRKVLGSSRLQLIQQFFTESTLFVFISLIIAMLLVQLILPSFNNLTGKQIVMNLWGFQFGWILIGLIFVITCMCTGAIPSLVLSTFSPAKVIKNQWVKVGGQDRLRQGLVVFQFCISSIIIIGTLLIKEQLQFLQNKELGFDKEHVLIVRSANALGSGYYAFLHAVRDHTAVQEVSTTQFMPGDSFDSTIFLPEQPSNYERTSLSYCHIDENFVDALQLELVDGRNFDLSYITDSTAYLINEKAAQRLGWENPVGKNLSYGGMTDGRVIGVVKDFNFTSLHNEIEPLVLRMAKSNLPNIFIRLNPGNLRDNLKIVEAEWKSKAPDAPFEYAFLDEEIQELYQNEQRMSSIFTGFAVLGIFVACLGLFGLASFVAEQRTKEVGIRKVLGATVISILRLMSKDFLKLVVVALIVAAPVAYYILDKWLEDFAYHIDFPYWIFLLTGAVTLIIAFITVSLHSMRTALLNPVDCLRNE